MLLFCRAYLFPFIFTTTASRQIHIVIRENVTRSCPGQHFELVDRETVNVHFEMISSVNGADQLFVTGQNGNTRAVSFPGCFRARLHFRLKKLIVNPYIESFLQLGTNIPCKLENHEIDNGLAHICANVTRTNWCPRSDNQKLRSMLKDKNTCRFCNLCQTLKSVDTDVEKHIQNEGPDQCNISSPSRTFSLKICMPSLKQLREKNHQYNGKLEEYWNYLKQGTVTAVVHIMDRPQLEASRLQQCERLCTIYRNQRSISESYRATLLRSIENLCVPADSYVACIYHTMKFDVIDK